MLCLHITCVCGERTSLCFRCHWPNFNRMNADRELITFCFTAFHSVVIKLLIQFLCPVSLMFWMFDNWPLFPTLFLEFYAVLCSVVPAVIRTNLLKSFHSILLKHKLSFLVAEWISAHKQIFVVNKARSWLSLRPLVLSERPTAGCKCPSISYNKD